MLQYTEDELKRCYEVARNLLKEAEKRAISRHRESLMKAWDRDVSYEEACQDWNDNHCDAWRARRMQCMLHDQRETISRHKWIESEKARKDLGRAAAADWVVKYAPVWRIQWEGSHLDE
ncbi:MAG: hypothetical protein GX117_07200 [Candidatus Hydrogenedentes bacterium]|nr:hypothetical protein [Candidatus Hydrogenedentota bacterium]